jgi:hypothetical protein
VIPATKIPVPESSSPGSKTFSALRGKRTRAPTFVKLLDGGVAAIEEAEADGDDKH